MGMFDWLTNPQAAITDAAQNVVGDVTNAGGSFLGNLVSAPFKAAAGFVRGAFGSLWNGVKYSAIVLGIQAFAAPVYNAAYGAIRGPEALQKLKEDREKNGLPGVVLHSAKIGFGTAAALGGASGAVENAGGGITGMLGTGLLIAAGSAVAIGALHQGDVKVADNDGHGTIPAATPGAKKTADIAK